MKRLFFLYLLLVHPCVSAQSKEDGDAFVPGTVDVHSTKHESHQEYGVRDELGLFPFENFTHEDSKGHQQNWFITQDRNGFIYSANGNGVLEFDGVSWRLISKPGLHAVRTVVSDNRNVKWVGADRDLGYLEPDSLGFLQYKSLKDQIPASHPLTGNVWQIFPDHDGVLFVTETKIYRWTGNEFRIVPRPGEIHREYQVNDNVYFRITGKGMYRLGLDSLQLIPDGRVFQDLRVDVALPFKKKSILFASRDAGLFVYDGVNATKWNNEVDSYLKEHILYAGQLLSDSSYAFATMTGGVIMMDKYGNCKRLITDGEGILNNQVYGLKQDDHKALWLALQTGISKVEPFMPYTFFDDKSGLEGTISTILRHKGTLYVGTYNGLFALKPRSGINKAEFHRLEEIKNGCFSLLSVGKDLLAATANGVFLITDGKVIEVKNVPACRLLFRGHRDPNRIFVGHRSGLSTIYLNDGKWQAEKDFEGVNADLRSISENDQGELWLGTTLHNIIRIRFPALNPGDKLGETTIENYGEEQGLPKETNSVFIIDNELFVSTNSEDALLFKFDPALAKFSRETKFGRRFGIDSLEVYPLGYQKDGDHILLASRARGGKSIRFSASPAGKSGSFNVARIYDERFRRAIENIFYWEKDSLLWIGEESLTRYDISIPIERQRNFKTFVRRVMLGQDSIVYGGEPSVFFKPIFRYSNNRVRFEFAAPGLTGKETKLYQFQLVGLDNEWSDWTTETWKDYTNLSEGDYQFVVRAKNSYGQLSISGGFNFVILPPWYRTWWAYILYAISFIGFFSLISQVRARKLKSEKKALALSVAERTEEIRSQANQLKVQAEKLQELDQAKSRFFANISHEFRTPLTLISGCLEDLARSSAEDKDRMRIRVMQKNSERLRQLIEQLLDLSKLENGKLRLNVRPVSPGNFLKAMISSFSSWAEQKSISLSVDLSENPITAYMDEDIMEKVVENLLSNAVKFTPFGGRVTFTGHWTNEDLTIGISDNGPGIPPEKIHRIFERFYQVDDYSTRRHEGSGIGLALVKELVSLHHGRISVESQPGDGTVFRFTIPINESSYSAHEFGSGSDENEKPLIRRRANMPTEIYREQEELLREPSIVLVVEDNVDLSHYIGDHLPGCSILLAGNGADGFNKAVENVPDLIISDVMMPEMDGVEFCKKIKEQEATSHIPVILLTAKADIESRLEGLETGADDYMTKPFDARELQLRVKNLIIQREKLKERFSRTVILKPKDIAITPGDEIFLNKVMVIVENHLGDSEFSVDDFQKEIGMSRMQLHRKLTALTGHSAMEFIRIQRLIRASELLSKTASSISDVCYLTGFTSLSYFAKCFKKQFGTAPKEYSAAHLQRR
jgi:signal transduction histidine kinase/DNA-binding response OmpR family regulator/ligand-binding sensor domain-containing protein